MSELPVAASERTVPVTASTLAFSGVVGQGDVKLALLLAAVQPRLGGVLLRGQKGSAKTTMARGLAALLPGTAPFVELPLGATEDRVLGSFDVAELLTTGTHRVRPGLLAAAHGGVLYVDEINLLADHLLDALLDVAVSGVNRIEREGISHTHLARFVLIGSMNPEEGELRPQLLDRFGLTVDVLASTSEDERAEVVRRQLALERPGAPEEFRAADEQLRHRLGTTGAAAVPESVVRTACRVALEVGAEGLRADLMLCRAAAALAAWERRTDATADDLRRVAPFVLAHRRRRTPFEAPGVSGAELEAAFEAAGEAAPASEPQPGQPGREEVVAPSAPLGPPALGARRAEAGPAGRRATSQAPAGRFVRERPLGEDGSVAAGPTALAVATRRAATAEAAVIRGDLRGAERERRTGNLIVLVVDASGSMGAQRRIATAKGAALGLLADAYQRRDRVAVVAFRGEQAETVLRPTASVEIAQARLHELPVGGTTPLAAGLEAALGVVRAAPAELQPLVVLITDGRATAGGTDPLDESRAAAARLARTGVPCVVVDAEQGPRLGLARDLAAALGADHVLLDDLSEGQLDGVIRSRLSRSW